MEVLRKPPIQDNAANLGGRALVLCATCPLAAVCAKAPIEKCEYVDDGGVSPAPEKAPEKQLTYQELLMDDAVPVVMARPVAGDAHVQRKPVNLPPKVQRKAAPKPRQAAKPVPKHRPRPALAERAGEAVADIFASLIGARGMAKAVKQRRA